MEEITVDEGGGGGLKGNYHEFIRILKRKIFDETEIEFTKMSMMGDKEKCLLNCISF